MMRAQDTTSSPRTKAISTFRQNSRKPNAQTVFIFLPPRLDSPKGYALSNFSRGRFIRLLPPPFILQIGGRRREQQWGGHLHRPLMETEAGVVMGKIAILSRIARPDKPEGPRHLAEIIGKILRGHHGLNLPDPVVADNAPGHAGHPVGLDGVIDHRGISPLVLHPARGSIKRTGFLRDFPDPDRKSVV